jgi:hypothetical protein
MNKDEISELTMYWYFLSSQFGAAGQLESDEFTDELIEVGGRLKTYLSTGQYTVSKPLNAWVSGTVGIAVWLDEHGDIQAGELSPK